MPRRPRTDLSHLTPEEKKAYKKARDRAYQLKNAEKIRLQRHEKYRANLEVMREKNRQRYLENREDRLARNRQWQQAHPERMRELSQRWKDANREQVRASGRAYAAKHRAEHPEQDKVYRVTHREEIRERQKLNIAVYRPQKNKRQKQRRAENPEYERAWRKAHPEASRLKENRRRARKRNLPDTFTKQQRHFMLQYWQHACAACGNQEGLWWTLADDHWIPVTSPHCPGTIATNMIPLCHGRGGCNNSKHNMEPHVWLAKHFSPTQAKRLVKAVETYFALVRERCGLAAAD